jgi:POT family proton-dependent oligopeptide transporter
MTEPSPANRRRWPAGIPFIVGNEAAERFSFYGMKSILFVYMTSLFLGFADEASVPAAVLKAAEDKATGRVHLFFAGVYAFPMLGALLADRALGKYRVIMGLSLVYCLGHAVLAGFGRSEWWMYGGLLLIALGSGGIKPCVSANVGDQFDASNADLVTRVYQIFYFTINFGSFFSTLITPWLYRRFGPDVAFGVPGVLMGVATLIFFLGRDRFVKVPPKPGGTLGALDFLAGVCLFLPFAIPAFLHEFVSVPAMAVASGVALVVGLGLFAIRQQREQDAGFFSVIAWSIRAWPSRPSGAGFFDAARARFGDEAAEGPPAVLRIGAVFSMVSVFWALFDQHSSSWINQAKRLDLSFTAPVLGDVELQASQIAALNPLMVMMIIPALNGVVYPALARLGLPITPLRKMTAGMFLAAASFLLVAGLQRWIDAAPPHTVSVLWQVIPYFVITTAEVLVSVTGLEFAYTQAPRAMKSTIMGLWLLCVTVGNLLVAFLSGFSGLPLVTFFAVFAGLMAVAAAIFAVLAASYRGKTYLQG